MIIFERRGCRGHEKAFTLAEVVVSIAILATSMAGLICGYIHVNYRAQYSAMSLCAQALAAQSVEQARAAKWDVHSETGGTGLGTSDELPPTNFMQIMTNALLIPATGNSVSVTNWVAVSNINTNPWLRMIRADCVWRAPFAGKWFSNTVITYRTCTQ